MSRITSSASGGTVKISDTSGAPLTSVDGALNVNDTGVAGFSTLTPGTPTQIMINTSSTLLIAANPDRKYAHIVNNSSETIFIQYSVSASLNQGIKLTPGTFYSIETSNLWLGSVNAIGTLGNQLIDILEGE